MHSFAKCPQLGRRSIMWPSRNLRPHPLASVMTFNRCDCSRLIHTKRVQKVRCFIHLACPFDGELSTDTQYLLLSLHAHQHADANVSTCRRSNLSKPCLRTITARHSRHPMIQRLAETSLSLLHPPCRRHMRQWRHSRQSKTASRTCAHQCTPNEGHVFPTCPQRCIHAYHPRLVVIP